MNSLATTDTAQRRLFELNRAHLHANALHEIERLEAAWLAPLSQQALTCQPVPTNSASLFAALDALLAPSDEVAAASAYVAEVCTLGAFRSLVADFAADALTEAQSFLPIVSRLPIEPRMPVMRVLIDEFGCGNLSRSHSYLYIELLRELGLPTEIDDHLASTPEEVFAFINLFHWLVQRARCPEWFLGGLAHLEAVIIDGFGCYVAACSRLGIIHDDYFREHIHIDAFHRREMRQAITKLEGCRPLDLPAVLAGARLAGDTFDAAFVAAVRHTGWAP